MQYEVEVRIKMIDTNVEAVQSLKESWDFGDNPKWTLAGGAYVIEQTAKSLSEKLLNELKTSNGSPLTNWGGLPRRAKRL